MKGRPDRIQVDRAWRRGEIRVTGRSNAGARAVVLTADGRGHWQVDGVPAPDVDGCLDVDLESSATTNVLPVRRLGLPRDSEDAPGPLAEQLATFLTSR